MAIENLEQSRLTIVPDGSGADITAVFSNGGVLELRGVVWSYKRDGKSSIARDATSAVYSAEGMSRGRDVFNSVRHSQTEDIEGGELT